MSPMGWLCNIGAFISINFDFDVIIRPDEDYRPQPPAGSKPKDKPSTATPAAKPVLTTNPFSGK